ADSLVKIWPGRKAVAEELAGGGRELLYLGSCGTSLVAAETEHVVIHDPASRAARVRIPAPEDSMAAACSDRAGRVLVGTERGALLYDMQGVKVAELRGHDSPVPEAVFSRDGARLGTIGMDGSVRVWDASSGALLHTITGDERDSSYPSSIEFDPSGDAVLVGDSEGKVIAWRITDGAPLRRAQLHRSTVIALRVSPDGEHLAAASADRSVSILRTDDLARERTLVEHQALITALAWSPDGALLATGSEDPSAYVWEVASGALVGGVRPGAGGVAGVAFSGDRLIAASRAGRIMSYPASRETHAPEELRAILSGRLPYRLGAGGIERSEPAEGCR